MAQGTTIRLFAKLLEKSEAPVWVISPSGRLAYVSVGCASWLGVDAAELIDRQSIAGAPVTDDPLDSVAAVLSPPPGFTQRGTASLKVQPPQVGAHRPNSIEVRFVRVGSGDSAFAVAVGGDFDDRSDDPDLRDAVAIRQRLDAWRRQQANLSAIAASGDSAIARRLRRRLRLAARVRTDVAFVGPPGCGSESMAGRVHALSAPGEPVVTVDGPLMDAELLDATLAAVVHPLTQASESCATVLVRSLDQMPIEAQQRLASLLDQFRGRLRLLALCGIATTQPPSQSEEETRTVATPTEVVPQSGLHSRLAEYVSTLVIPVEPLASRVDDLPVLSSALLDQQRAAGATAADRINRAALDALVLYPWPGNFDELHEAIGHAARRATSSTIGADLLPLAIRTYSSGDNPAAKQQRYESLDEALAKFELRLITEALQAAGGNRAEAARRLGVSRARLLRRLKDAPHPETEQR